MKHVANELLRYFAASLIALAVDIGLFSFLLRIFGLPWALSATIAFLAGVFVAYRLSIHFVFRERLLAHAPRQEFVAFATIGIVGLGVTQVVLWLGIEHYHAHPEMTKLVAAGITFLCNFAMRKLMLFRKRVATY